MLNAFMTTNKHTIVWLKIIIWYKHHIASSAEETVPDDSIRFRITIESSGTVSSLLIVSYDCIYVFANRWKVQVKFKILP